MEIAGDGPPLAHGTVELVPSVRGGRKAMYGGRTFTLETDNGIRYRWRCDVRPCRSRLTTDAYGEEHMVYAFRPHDEEVDHREAARKRRRFEATYKQAVTKIADYGYVLENQVEDMLFWRCEYVSCPGRCRTTPDLRVIAGPSRHLKQLHNQGSRPETLDHVGDSPIPTKLDKSDSNKSHLPDAKNDGQSNTPLMSFYRQQRQLEEKYQNLRQPKKMVEERQEEQRESGTSTIVTSKQEPASEPDLASLLPPAVDAVGDVVTSRDAETNLRFHTQRSASANGRIPVARSTLHPDTHLKCPSQPAVQPSVVPAVVEDTRCIALSETEEKDKDDTVHVKMGAGADIAEADEELSYKSADSLLFGQSHLTSRSRRLRCAEVLEITAGSDCDSRVRDLRAGILGQMRRLLKAETYLAKERLQAEVLRGSLLKRNLGSFAVNKEPDWHALQASDLVAS